MKLKTLSVTAFASAACLLLSVSLPAQDLDSAPPVVVKTVPESGSREVPSGEIEIKVVFSKEMIDGSWSPADAWKDSTPEIVGKPAYGADHKTWTMRVKLEAGKTYGYWLNSQKFSNFKDTQGHPAVPYLLVFKTRGDERPL